MDFLQNRGPEQNLRKQRQLIDHDAVPDRRVRSIRHQVSARHNRVPVAYVRAELLPGWVPGPLHLRGPLECLRAPVLHTRLEQSGGLQANAPRHDLLCSLSFVSRGRPGLHDRA